MTVANGLDETCCQEWVCLCSKTDSTYTGVVPPFTGNDYFCATVRKTLLFCLSVIHFRPNVGWKRSSREQHLL